VRLSYVGISPPQMGEPTADEQNSTISSTLKRVREAIAVVRAAQSRQNFPKRARPPPAPPPAPLSVHQLKGASGTKRDRATADYAATTVSKAKVSETHNECAPSLRMQQYIVRGTIPVVPNAAWCNTSKIATDRVKCGLAASSSGGYKLTPKPSPTIKKRKFECLSQSGLNQASVQHVEHPGVGVVSGGVWGGDPLTLNSSSSSSDSRVHLHLDRTFPPKISRDPF
jgi:hypothetical protein